MSAFLAAVTVFLISMQTVIGPTPPGTGVMKPAFSFTAAPRHTIHTITAEVTAIPVWPICVLSNNTTSPHFVLYVSASDCCKDGQTLWDFQLLIVLITVNSRLTGSPQIRCYIQRYAIFVHVLRNPSRLHRKKTKKNRTWFKRVHLQSPRHQWAGPSLFSGPGCDWCPHRWRLPLPSPCQLWSDQESLHDEHTEDNPPHFAAGEHKIYSRRINHRWSLTCFYGFYGMSEKAKKSVVGIAALGRNSTLLATRVLQGFFFPFWSAGDEVNLKGDGNP